MIYDALCREWFDNPELEAEECADEMFWPRPVDDTRYVRRPGSFVNTIDPEPDALRMPYSDYLTSPHWRQMRELMRQRAGGMCQRCYATERRLEVHHETYDRLGCEAEADLIVLCEACHHSAHGIRQ